MLLLRAHRRCSVASGGRCINANRQGSHRTRNRTNAGMRPVTMDAKSPSLGRRGPAHYARLFMERLLYVSGDRDECCLSQKL